MTYPVWGCPWHGPVQGSQLTLPTGGSRTFPQPAAKADTISGVLTSIPDTYGTTYRVAVPGIPEVTLTPEDVAAGRLWRNEATISGGRFCLFGKLLDGWIYIDPDGARWLVRCAQLNEAVQYSTASGLTLTVTLSRFGDLGMASEVHSYSATLSGWGIDLAPVPSTVRLTVDDVRSDGAAAVINVHQRTFNNGTSQDVRRAHSFLELTITGAGAEASVSIGVVRTKSQVVQTTKSDYDPQPYLAGWHKLAISEGGSGEWEWITFTGDFGEGENPLSTSTTRAVSGTTVEWWEVLKALVWSGTASVNCRRIVAMWYAEDGALIEVVLRYIGTYVIDWAMPADGERTATVAFTWSAQMEVAGEPGAVVEGSQMFSKESSFPAGSSGVASMFATSTITVDTVEASTEISGLTHIGLWEEVTATGQDNFLSPEDVLLELLYTGGFVPWTTPGGLGLVRYSNHVIGIRVTRQNPPSAIYAFHPPSTPSGAVSDPVYVPSPGSLAGRFGSWCPYTHETKWHATTPVCYV